MAPSFWSPELENKPAPVRCVFYATATAQSTMYAIDYVAENADGQLVSVMDGKTQAELSQEHGREVLIADLDAYALIQENLYKTEPRKITEDEFIQALEVLPPLQWCRHQGVESFRWTEFYSGNITSIFVRQSSGTCWTFRDNAFITTDAILAKVAEAEAKAASASMAA